LFIVTTAAAMKKRVIYEHDALAYNEAIPSHEKERINHIAKAKARKRGAEVVFDPKGHKCAARRRRRRRRRRRPPPPPPPAAAAARRRRPRPAQRPLEVSPAHTMRRTRPYNPWQPPSGLACGWASPAPSRRASPACAAPACRRDFVTGFRKRKQQRRKDAHQCAPRLRFAAGKGGVTSPSVLDSVRTRVRLPTP
jgi:hypothetical protein